MSSIAPVRHGQARHGTDTEEGGTAQATTAAAAKVRSVERSGAARVVVLIPAHNEGPTIGMTVRYALNQTYPPHRVLVMADNCTDDTIEVARAAGAEVVETIDNTDKKGGAVNQGLAMIIPMLGDDDFVITMDADGGVMPDFIENALQVFRERPDLGGLCGSVLSRAQHQDNWIQTAQAIEYERGVRIMARKGGKINCLSGAASFFKVHVLKEVARSRGSILPGEQGGYMMKGNLVEDYELTLAIRALGYSITSTKRCQFVTDLMPTVKMLEAQRMRWYRGTIETLRIYGWKPYTRFNISSISFNMFCAALLYVALFAMAFVYLAFGSTPNFWYSLLAPPFLIETYINARRVGTRKAKLLALSFFPVWIFDSIQFLIYWRALKHILQGKVTTWDGDQEEFA